MSRRTLSAAARLAAAGALIVLTGIALAGTAQAKGPESATIEGPGLARPVPVRWDSGPVRGRMDDLVAVTSFMSYAARLPLASAAAPRDRGPAYTVRYRVGRVTAGRAEEFRQVLYPASGTEPVTYVYTPPGQTIWGQPARGGWTVSPADLTPFLQAYGVTVPAAHAKGPESATIEGAGQPVLAGWAADGAEGGLRDLIDVTGFSSLAAGGAPARSVDAPDTPGPAYTVRYLVGNDAAGRPEEFRQVLHPSSSAGSLIHTPPGQTVWGQPAAGGWAESPVNLTLFLKTYGITVAVSPPQQPATPAAQAADTTARWIPATAATAVLLLAAGAIHLVRRRRQGWSDL